MRYFAVALTAILLAAPAWAGSDFFDRDQSFFDNDPKVFQDSQRKSSSSRPTTPGQNQNQPSNLYGTGNSIADDRGRTYTIVGGGMIDNMDGTFWTRTGNGYVNTKNGQFLFAPPSHR